MGQSLKNRTTRASAIVFLGFGTSQILRLGGNLITTRILTPDLFGVMSLAMAFAASALLLADPGFSLSIMQNKRGGERDFLRTVFSMKVIQGALLAVILVLIALLIYLLAVQGIFPDGSVYANSDLPKAIAIVALGALIKGFASIEIEFNQRELRFGRQIILEVGSQVAAIAFIITTGIIEPTIYSLAFATVVSNFVLVVGSYLVFPLRNAGFGWCRESIKDVFHFGKWIAGSSMTGLISQHGDRLLFGFMLTTAQMGQYAIAILIFRALEDLFKKGNQVLFPALSQVIRDDPRRVSEVYYKLRVVRDFAVCTCAGVLVVCGDLLIALIYDERYSGAGWMLQILCLSFFINAFQLKGLVVTARGMSKMHFQVSLWRSIGFSIMIVGLYYAFGIVGAIFAVPLRFVLGAWIPFYYFHQFGYLRWLRELQTFGFIALGLAIGFGVRWMMIWLLPTDWLT